MKASVVVLAAVLVISSFMIAPAMAQTSQWGVQVQTVANGSPISGGTIFVNGTATPTPFSFRGDPNKVGAYVWTLNTSNLTQIETILRYFGITTPAFTLNGTGYVLSSATAFPQSGTEVFVLVYSVQSIAPVTFTEQGISGSSLPPMSIGNATYPLPYSTSVYVGSSITFGFPHHWTLQTNGVNVEYNLTQVMISQGYSVKTVTTYPPQPSYTLTVDEYTTITAVYAAPTTTPTGAVSVTFTESGLPSGGLVTLNGTAYPLPYSSSFSVNSTVTFAFAVQFTGGNAIYALSGLSLQVPGRSAVGYPAQTSYSIPLYYNDTTITAQYNLASPTPPSTTPSTTPISTSPVSSSVSSSGSSWQVGAIATAAIGAIAVAIVAVLVRRRSLAAG